MASLDGGSEDHINIWDDDARGGSYIVFGGRSNKGHQKGKQQGNNPNKDQQKQEHAKREAEKKKKEEQTKLLNGLKDQIKYYIENNIYNDFMKNINTEDYDFASDTKDILLEKLQSYFKDIDNLKNTSGANLEPGEKRKRIKDDLLNGNENMSNIRMFEFINKLFTKSDKIGDIKKQYEYELTKLMNKKDRDEFAEIQADIHLKYGIKLRSNPDYKPYIIEYIYPLLDYVYLVQTQKIKDLEEKDQSLKDVLKSDLEKVFKATIHKLTNDNSIKNLDEVRNALKQINTSLLQRKDLDEKTQIELMRKFIDTWSNKKIEELKQKKHVIKELEKNDDEIENTIPKALAPSYSSHISSERAKYLTGIPKYMMEIYEILSHKANAVAEALRKYVETNAGDIIKEARTRGGRTEKITYHKYDTIIDANAEMSASGIELVDYTALPFNLSESIGERFIMRGTPRENPNSLLYSIFYCMSDLFRSVLNIDQQIQITTRFRTYGLAALMSHKSPFWDRLEKYYASLGPDEIALYVPTDFYIQQGIGYKVNVNKIIDFFTSVGDRGRNIFTYKHVHILSLLFSIDIYVLNLREQVILKNNIFDKYTQYLQENYSIIAMEDGVIRERPSVYYDPSQLYGKRPIIVL